MSIRYHLLFPIGLALFAAILLSACHNRQTGEMISSSRQSKEKKESPFIAGNQRILHWENEEIELFIKRYGWNMQKTGTGLHIQILEPGSGETFKEGDEVRFGYQTFLLDGKMIYDSKEDGDKQFRVARSEEISGLHEAAQMLRPGAKARLVIPSYLAYGVAGDGDRINGRNAIAMIVEIQ